jgi:hypothetical protein
MTPKIFTAKAQRTQSAAKETTGSGFSLFTILPPRVNDGSNAILLSLRPLHLLRLCGK